MMQEKMTCISNAANNPSSLNDSRQLCRSDNTTLSPLSESINQLIIALNDAANQPSYDPLQDLTESLRSADVRFGIADSLTLTKCDRKIFLDLDDNDYIDAGDVDDEYGDFQWEERLVASMIPTALLVPQRSQRRSGVRRGYQQQVGSNIPLNEITVTTKTDSGSVNPISITASVELTNVTAMQRIHPPAA